jgi:prepilin-type N-terminal cleavage/methylation domain-containing protein
VNEICNKTRKSELKWGRLFGHRSYKQYRLNSCISAPKVNQIPLEVFNDSEYLIIMRQSQREAGKDNGFTMIEMIFVLIVLVIVAAVLMSRYLPTGTNELMIETDGLKTSLRYAQMKAMNDTVDSAPLGWGIFPNSTSYTLVKNNITATSNLPGEKPPTVSGVYSPTHTLATGVTVAITAGGVTIVAFNEWGAPIDASGVPVTSNVTLALTKAGETPTNITVTKNTGFIP